LAEEYKGQPEGTPYNIAISKRGQKKVISKSIKSDKFQDSVEITYSDVNKRETTIRIAKNGSINIISAGYGNKKLPNEIIEKINRTSALNLQEYKKVYPSKNKLELIPDITYKYLIFAQFNIYPKKFQDTHFINLSSLGNLLKKNIKKVNGRDVLVNYFIEKYEVNSGEILSKNNKMTNPLINFTLIPIEQTFFKINVIIYKRGAVQLRLSSNTTKSTRVNLDYEVLNQLYTFLESLLTKLMSGTDEIIVSDQQKLKKGVTNMRDGRQPQMCHDRQGLRPVPYSFHGVCPDPNMYIRPEGKKRPDGNYEPCCYKIKDNGKDARSRYKNIIKYGYPDNQAGKYDENIPNPDTKSATFIPGTNKLESRRFSGLMSMEKDELLGCIKDFGYMKESGIFDKEYPELKNKVLLEYSFLVGTKKLIKQHPLTLTPGILSTTLKRDSYIVTPINNETIEVFLFFNNTGSSHFINENYDISETSLPEMRVLSDTIIEGYLYPYKNELVFYPIDILYLKGRSLSTLPFYSVNTKDTRFNNLMYSLENINSINSEQLVIESDRFDLDVTNGIKNYLTNKSYGDVSSLLFIPLNGDYTFGKINKKLFIWNNINKESNKLITLNVKYKSGNKWEIGIDSKSIPSGLLPQDSGTIEIPVVFSNKNKLSDGDLVLFQINLLTNNQINTKKPLIAINKQEEKLTDYFTVINILESIQSPITKTELINL
jgi:hypothetical protein